MDGVVPNGIDEMDLTKEKGEEKKESNENENEREKSVLTSSRQLYLMGVFSFVFASAPSAGPHSSPAQEGVSHGRRTIGCCCHFSSSFNVLYNLLVDLDFNYEVLVDYITSQRVAR